MVTHNALIRRQGRLASQRPFSREGHFVTTGLINPLEHGGFRAARSSAQNSLFFLCFIILILCFFLGLLNRLRIAKGVAENDLLAFQLGWHVDARDPLTILSSERVLAKVV